jgi:hypothetical protein
MNEELERTWKEVVVVYFEVLPQESRRETEENREEPQSGQSVVRMRFDPGNSGIQLRGVESELHLLDLRL